MNLEIYKTMKPILILLTLVATLVGACGDKKQSPIPVTDLISNGNLEELRARKRVLSENKITLEHEIDLLDSVINTKSDNKKLPLVTIFEVQVQNFDHYIELQGIVTTKQNVLIYPETAGTLLKVHVKEGQKVNKGQTLATIDNGGMASQLQQMKTQLKLVKTTYQRQERLWKQKIGTEIQYLEAKTNFEFQQNSVKQVRSQLNKYTIKAPFSGIIDQVIKDQGNVVAPGGPGTEVFRLINLSNMFIEVLVPESYISNITIGKEVKVFFPVLNKTILSKIKQTGNFINPNNRSFTVKISVSNKGGNIKPNMTAKVHINDYSNEQAILIPQSIISENAKGEQYAFVVSNVNAENIADAHKNIIKTGKTQSGYVEVLSGIAKGQNIIQEGARSVKDGQQVKILMQ